MATRRNWTANDGTVADSRTNNTPIEIELERKVQGARNVTEDGVKQLTVIDMEAMVQLDIFQDLSNSIFETARAYEEGSHE